MNGTNRPDSTTCNIEPRLDSDLVVLFKTFTDSPGIRHCTILNVIVRRLAVKKKKTVLFEPTPCIGFDISATGTAPAEG